ncbi:autotransporter outer membrane beta-barrel domain-containing protein [Cupriavidus agavae]|nr:autotransporter outer membrane beta-barrel domain-containing protein [Cupriavidus agavae]
MSVSTRFPRPRRYLGVALLGLALPSAPRAQTAYCGAIPGGSYGSVVCEPAIGVAAEVQTAEGGSFNSTSGPTLRAYGRQASATISVVGSTFANSSATTANAVGVQVNGGVGDATARFTGGNSTITASGSGTFDAVSVVNNTAGASLIDVAAGARVDIVNAVGGDERDGFDIKATGGGNATVSHAGTGTIVTAGGHGVWIRGNGGSALSAQVGSGVSMVIDNRLASPNDTAEAPGPEAGAANHAGIRVLQQGGGTVNIVNGAAIQGIGENAFGILGNATTGAITIANTGNISTDGTAGSAIRAGATGGDIGVANSGSLLTTGANGHGIYVSSSGGSGNVTVENSGRMLLGSPGAVDGSRGIYVIAVGAGNATITGTGDITLLGNAATTRGFGITASAVNGNVAIDYSGAFSTAGNGAAALRAHSTAGNASVNYTGSRIETFHSNANGIYVTSDSTTASASITAGGTIITHADAGTGDGSGVGSFGLQATTRGGPVSVRFTGPAIDVNGSGAAIVAGSATGSGNTGAGTVTIGNAGALTARGNAQRGIWSFSRTGAQTVTNTGVIQTLGDVGSQGIYAQGTGVADIAVVNSGAITTRGSDASGIEATSSGGTVDVTNTQPVQGGWNTSAGVATGGAVQRVRNASALGALSDVAVLADTGTAGSLQLVNTGQMTGVVTAATSTASIDNAGTWNLRRFVDAAGTGTRDTWRVAISNLGTSGANVLTNTGTLSLAAQPGGNGTMRTPADAIVYFDTAGAYLPLGRATNMPTPGGAAQGKLLGVGTFRHTGTIDLTGGATAVGNVLVITGGQVAGVAGGGQFVSNGGALKLNAVLDEGGAVSRSDMLVVDATSTGAGGPTRVAVTNQGGAGALTVGSGIPLVEILDTAPAASAPDAFALNGRAVAGAYEYRLFRGDQDGANTDVWYLRSERGPDPAPPGPPRPLYRPEVAAYLANQRLAGQMFVHSLHDRLGEPQWIEQQGFDPAQDKPRAGWLRAVGNWQGSRSKDGVFKTSTDAFLLHGGVELARWDDSPDTDRGHAGLMLSYGTASTDATAAGNDFRAKGKVEGWSVGAYGTWYQNDERKLGAYVDTWFQYGWFTNRVQGDLLPTVRYNAQGLALSGEVGYALPVRDGWVVEPQAQLIYARYDEDDITEPNGTRVSGADSSGLITRLGVRTHRTWERDDGRRVQPYLTLNWWYSDTDSNVTFNQLPMGTMYPHNRFEVKLGANVDLGRRLTGWANVSGSWGQQDYYQYAVRVGVKYAWK